MALLFQICVQASHKSASKHDDAKVGNKNIKTRTRYILIKEITNKFNYQRLVYTKPDYVNNISKIYVYGNNFFNLSDPMWNKALYWQ